MSLKRHNTWQSRVDKRDLRLSFASSRHENSTGENTKRFVLLEDFLIENRGDYDTFCAFVLSRHMQGF